MFGTSTGLAAGLFLAQHRSGPHLELVRDFAEIAPFRGYFGVL
jgi:hypothetical protein